MQNKRIFADMERNSLEELWKQQSADLLGKGEEYQRLAEQERKNRWIDYVVIGVIIVISQQYVQSLHLTGEILSLFIQLAIVAILFFVYYLLKFYLRQFLPIGRAKNRVKEEFMKQHSKDKKH